jgi:hypothetical protein
MAVMFGSVTSWSSTISMSFLYRNTSSNRMRVVADIRLMLTVAILNLHGMFIVLIRIFRIYCECCSAPLFLLRVLSERDITSRPIRSFIFTFRTTHV